MISAHPDDTLAEATWIDLFQPTPEELERVRHATALRVPTHEEVSEIESTSRLAFEKTAYYLSAPLVGPRGDGELELSSVGFVLSARVLLTVRFAVLPSFDVAAATNDERTAEGAFLRLLEVIVDRSADELERAGSECDELSHGVFRRHPGRATPLRGTLNALGRIANRTSHIRDALLGLGRIASFVTESAFEGAPRVNPARMRAVRADVASLTDYESHLSSKVQFLLDATLGFINVEQNDIVKTLTVASVAGIPPVLIAGIYGMNFRVMPELGWPFGYPMAMALIVVSAIVPVLWFKRRGWL